MRHYFYHTFYWTQAPYHTTESVCGYGQEHRLSILCRDAAARPRSVQTLHHSTSTSSQQPYLETWLRWFTHYITLWSGWNGEKWHPTFYWRFLEAWRTIASAALMWGLPVPGDRCSGANGLQWPLTSVTPTQAGARCAAFLSQLFPYFLSGLHNFRKVYKCLETCIKYYLCNDND